MSLRNKIGLLFYFPFLFLASFQSYGAKFNNDIANLFETSISSKAKIHSAIDSQGNTWVKGTIPDSLLNIAALFQIPSVHVGDYELYVYQNGALERIKQNKDSNNKIIKSRYPLHYFVASKPEYYLNIKHQSVHTLDILIKEFGEFGQLASLNVMQISLYYGLAIMSIIFNFVFYTIFRDPRFILYSLLQLCIFSSFFYEDGMFYYFSGHTWNLPYFLVWNVPICTTLAALFTYYFLNLKKNMPHFKNLAVPVVTGLFILACLYTWTDNPFLYTISNIAWYILPMICFYQAIKLFKQDPYARFLILSFGVLVFVAAGYTLHRNYDSGLFSFFNINTLRLASAIEIIAISFALIFNVRTLREENARYKVELRHYLELLSLNREIEQERKKITVAAHPGPAKNVIKESEVLIEEIKEVYQLTDREADVLKCIWEGDSNKEISDKLFISINTTKFHVSKLYAKLDVNNRSQARSLREDSTFHGLKGSLSLQKS